MPARNPPRGTFAREAADWVRGKPAGPCTGDGRADAGEPASGYFFQICFSWLSRPGTTGAFPVPWE